MKKYLFLASCLGLCHIAPMSARAADIATPAPQVDFSPDKISTISFNRNDMVTSIKANPDKDFIQRADNDIMTYGTGLMENYDAKGRCHSVRRDEQDRLINSYAVRLDKNSNHFIINYRFDKVNVTPISLSICGKTETVQEKGRDTTTGTVTLDARRPDTKDISDFYGRHIATVSSHN